ncbi:MAG: hypothetical protein LBF81_02435 [Prevotellaceae bacterium]|nr:hypothetical protein [Prevotellaceae bacterium]
MCRSVEQYSGGSLHPVGMHRTIFPPFSTERASLTGCNIRHCEGEARSNPV